MAEDKLKVLVFSMTTEGGLAEHIFYQAKALRQAGNNVDCLCSRKFLVDRKNVNFKLIHVLLQMPSVKLFKPLRRFLQVFNLVFNHFCLAFFILIKRPDIVLIDSYREYLAPLWAWAIKLSIKITGSICVVNLHDPVRDNQIGPPWWHHLSVKQGFSFVHIALVHAPLPAEAQVPKNIMIIEVPVGVYEMSDSLNHRTKTRGSWGLKDNDLVLLSFGFIRDNKNIDLLIKALGETEKTFLVVAGRVQSSNDKPVSFYKELANSCGVSNRCFFFSDFIPDSEIPDFFNASDFVALTYSATFYSQSGVLNIAAAAKKPVIASGAEGPLLESVRKYHLGVLVQPESLSAIVEGINRAKEGIIEPDWAGYSKYAGWDRNIDEILNAYTNLMQIRNN